MYVHIINNSVISTYSQLPHKIRTPDGFSRTSLHELSAQELESLGLFEYQEISPEYNSVTHYWDNSYIYDHENKTATKNIQGKSLQDAKAEMLRLILMLEVNEQNSGYTCTNGIKLQVRDQDLINWTQLMAGIMAFQPETVSVRDFDNVTHSLPTAEVSQMLAEVFVFGQTLYAKTWAAKDALSAAETLADVEAITH